MYGQPAFDLIRKIRSDPKLRAIQIIVHSASRGASDERQRALALGANRVVAKLIEPGEFLAHVEECLAERARYLEETQAD